MKRGKPLDRGGPLKRTTPLRAKADKPKRKAVPQPRTASDGPSERALEDAAKKVVGRRSGGDCEIRTPWCLGRATNFSHRRHKGQGGPWSASNGLDACGWGNATGCHGYLHQHPVEAKENGWLVSSRGDWAKTPAWIWHRGRRGKYLLDDEGEAVLAPFPQGDPRHPDDIPVPLLPTGDDMRGYYGVAIYHPRHEDNVGTLWRSAKTYDAAFLATVGRRYDQQASDTCKTPLSVPLHHYSDLDDLIAHLPHGCPLVGVELDDRSVSLAKFAHPLRALYLLGAEDHGLPQAVLDRCHHVVQIPTPQAWSLNVAVAGSLLMHDRFTKGPSRAERAA